MTTQEYLESLNFDLLSATETLKEIVKVADVEFECDEQRMFVIHKIIDSNTNEYVKFLKLEIQKYHELSDQLQSKLKRVTEKYDALIAKEEEAKKMKAVANEMKTKKKVLIVKRKPTEVK